MWFAVNFAYYGAFIWIPSPEVYPTALRGTGTGAAAGFGRIASVLAPLSVPFLLDLGGSEALLFAVFGAFFAVAAAATWGLPGRRGETLDHWTEQVNDR